MYSGTLISGLLTTVEKAEEAARKRLQDKTAPHPGSSSGNGGRGKGLETEQLTQSLGLRAADRDFGLLLVVHAQLVGALEPGNDFPNPVDID